MFIKNSEEELIQYWEKCYVDQETKDAFFIALETKAEGEESLAYFEFNIKLWSQYYSCHKAIFDKVKFI